MGGGSGGGYPGDDGQTYGLVTGTERRPTTSRRRPRTAHSQAPPPCVRPVPEQVREGRFGASAELPPNVTGTVHLVVRALTSTPVSATAP